MSELREQEITAFQILGPLGIRVAGRRTTVRAPRQRSVLAMLLLWAGRVVPLDQLIEAVWPDGPPATGRTQIAICVTALRKLFREAGCADDVIITGPHGYLLPLQPHRIDAVEFAERVADGRGAVRQGRTAAAIARFTEALAMWQGPAALPELRGRPVESATSRLEQERLVVREELAALKLAIGQHDTVAGELAVLVGEHPTRQTARAQLMLAQYRSGWRAEALATFAEGQRVAERSTGELGPALLDLHEAILNDSPSLAVEASGGTAVVTRSERAPAQLPADVPAFTGRFRELSVLDHLVGDGPGDGSPSVGLLTGGPGIGKTGLAVHWARGMADRFPDGQLFVDLHGYDSDEPADASAVLDGFLRALGVPADWIPESLAERAALYRGVLDQSRVLVLLDNARSFAQIAPLIPGGNACCVLVTSRAQLGDLIDRHGATRLRLDPLDIAASVELLGRMVSDVRVAGDPDGTVQLAGLCDGLPLALRIVAARLVAKPHWTIDDLIDRLAEPARRLDELSAGGQDVRARMLASYRDLAPRVAMLFRRLGTMEQVSFDVQVAGALVGTTSRDADCLLESLVDAHLVDVVGRGGAGAVRYRLNMLPLLFARERAEAEMQARTGLPWPWRSGDLAV